MWIHLPISRILLQQRFQVKALRLPKFPIGNLGQRVADALANASGTFSLHGIKFKLKVDGSPEPITVDLSSYNDASVSD